MREIQKFRFSLEDYVTYNECHIVGMNGQSETERQIFSLFFLDNLLPSSTYLLPYNPDRLK